MTLQEMGIMDSLGYPKFEAKQARAMVQRILAMGQLDRPEPECSGQGIVVVGGGKYLSWAWVLCRRLRDMGSKLPIQVWHIGEREMPRWSRPLFAKLDVELVDIFDVMRTHPVRQMSGWIAKTYAVRHCPWEQVMFIDADCFPAILPEDIFGNHLVQSEGSLLFRDVGKHHKGPWGYMAFGMMPPPFEMETGQFVWHKRRAWRALCWALWCSEHTDVFYRDFFYGDKGVIDACFRFTKSPFMLGEHSEWMGFGINHWLDGKLTFQHCMGIKRGEQAMFPWMRELFAEWDVLAMGKAMPRAA